MSEPSTSACGACGVDDCPSRVAPGDSAEQAADAAGAAMARAAVITFVLPLLCAVAASACISGSEGLRIGAAFLGLAIGIVAARLLQHRSVA